MNAKKISTLFKHPEQITSEDLIGLRQAVNDFPYSAPLHALYMKALQKKESYLLPGQIKRSAIATPNRAALKAWHDQPIAGMKPSEVVSTQDSTEVQASVKPAATAPKSKPKQEARAVVEPKQEKAESQRTVAPEKPVVQTKSAPKAEVKDSKSTPPPVPKSAPEPAAATPSTPVVEKAAVAPSAPAPKSTPKPAAEQDLSHLPEAVRNAILRSRALRGDEAAETASPAASKPAVEEKPVKEKAVPVKETQELPKVKSPSEPKDQITAESGKDSVAPMTASDSIPETEDSSDQGAEKVEPIQELDTEEKPEPKAELETVAKSADAPEPTIEVAWEEKSEPEEAVEVEVPEVREMPFSEKASFMDWLNADISTGKPVAVERSGPKDVRTIISELPKFEVPKRDEKIDVFHLMADEQGKFVTETLAEIYLKQGLWDKAINAYEVLSLKYPEKSGFFADRIREIKKHKK